MAHCFFIGIGGTGAKCAEALIHLLAAGLGPERCTLMLIDQDEPNGNAVRTIDILGRYIDLRRRLGSGGSAASPLFRTELVAPQGGVLWCPTTTPGATLGKICGYDLLDSKQQSHRDLIDALYLPEERDQSLGEGFRAHPSVGAAVLLAQTRTADQFWKNVFDTIDAASRGQKVKIFLLGSIFGGTGAAGFPTIARLIRDEVREKAGNAVEIGGALMLPYFYFPRPTNNSNELLPDSSMFLEQTKGALNYYFRLLTEETLFDQLYVAGWQPLLRIRSYHKGGPEQQNPALIPELYAGLIALRFFLTGDSEPVKRFEREDGDVGWRDLPLLQPNGDGKVRDKLGSLIRFAHSFHTVYRSTLGPDEHRRVQRETWFRRLVDPSGTILVRPDSQKLLDDVDAYCARFLFWAANIDFSGAADVGGGERVRLYNSGQFAHEIKDEATLERAQLRDPPEAKRDLGAFGRLIEGEDGPDLSLIFDRLTYQRFEFGPPGITGFLRALHQSCGNYQS